MWLGRTERNDGDVNNRNVLNPALYQREPVISTSGSSIFAKSPSDSSASGEIPGKSSCRQLRFASRRKHFFGGIDAHFHSLQTFLWRIPTYLVDGKAIGGLIPSSSGSGPGISLVFCATAINHCPARFGTSIVNMPRRGACVFGSSFPSAWMLQVQ
jgi:hypothetical protein